MTPPYCSRDNGQKEVSDQRNTPPVGGAIPNGTVVELSCGRWLPLEESVRGNRRPLLLVQHRCTFTLIYCRAWNTFTVYTYTLMKNSIQHAPIVSGTEECSKLLVKQRFLQTTVLKNGLRTSPKRLLRHMIRSRGYQPPKMDGSEGENTRAPGSAIANCPSRSVATLDH